MEHTDGRTFHEEANIPKERYFNESYFTRSQFDSLVSQLLIVHKLSPKSILEVGPGNGFVSDFLRKSGKEVITFDINSNLNPDVVGNLTKIEHSFSPNSFDLILCAEVLEHLPFENFESILKQFKTIARKNVVITLPRNHHILIDYSSKLKIPFIPYLHFNFFLRLPNRIKWENHHWEVDYTPMHSLKRLKAIMEKYFSVKDCFSDSRNRVHQFFILAKKKE